MSSTPVPSTPQSSTSPATHVIVVGSANQDYILRVPSAPVPGETVLAQAFERQPGGKGANQAVAAARMGAEVTFIGAVGDDGDGATIEQGLAAEGIDVTAIDRLTGVSTGMAMVTVFDDGDNSIIVVPGANFALVPERVAELVRQQCQLHRQAIVVLQAELTTEVIAAALTAAADAGARRVFNLAPYRDIGQDLLPGCDPLILNETEAGDAVGFVVDGVESAQAAAEQLTQTVTSIVITLGSNGAWWATQSDAGHVPAPPVAHVVDSTGAGDAFVGALASSLAAGSDLAEAVALGVRAGSFAVGRLGAQSSYATEAQLRAQQSGR